MPEDKTQIHACKKCNIGTVKVEIKASSVEVNVTVNRCSNCNYQYRLKELWDDQS